MEEELDLENPGTSLIKALCEEEPQDLYQLEDMTGLDKTLIDNYLRELEEEKIVISKYEDRKFSPGIFIKKRVYYLDPLCKKLYSILFDYEERMKN